MKKIFYILVSAIVALGAVACNNEIDENIEVNNGGEVSFTVSLDDRVIIGDRDETTKKHPITFEKGDVIYASNDAVKPFTFVCDNVTAEGVATFICREQNEDQLQPTVMDGKTLNFYTNLEPNSEAGADGIVLKADNVLFEDKEGMSIALSLDCPVFAYTATDAVEMTASTPIFNIGGTLESTIDIAATTEVSFIAIQDNGDEKVKVEYSIAGTKVKEFELDFQPMIYNLGVLTTAVATVGDKTYTVLQTAIDKAAAMGTQTEVTIANDSELDATVLIPAGADIVLNLNGNTLTGTMHKNDGAVIRNEGTLTIKGGTISSTADNGGSAVLNKGTMTIEEATLNGAPNAGSSWPSYTINNDGGTLTIEDAYITSYHGAVCSYNDGAVVTLSNTDIDMTGITGFTSHALYTYNNGKIIVNGGNIANNNDMADQNSSGASVINGNVTVNSGNFTGRIEAYYGTPVLNGGTYNVKPNAAYISEGRIARDNGNGTWSVLGAVAEVNGVQYALVDDAFAAIESTGTVKLIGDATVTDDVTVTVGAGKNITLDLNGKTLTANNTRTATHNVLFDAKGGTLTVNNGTITYNHTGNNMAWDGAATVFDVTAGGVLKMNGVKVNVDGTDMNFCVHLNNWGEVTFEAEDCEFNATYCGVRVFNSGFDKNNVTIKNSKMTGATRAFWVHNYIGDLDATKHTNAAVNARLNFNVFGNGNTYELTGEATSPVRYGMSSAIYFNPENGNRVVGNATDLTRLANYVNEGIERFYRKTVEVVKDIDLASAEWTPIGTTTNTFRGTFEGNNHIIKNLVVTGNNSNVGLFGMTTEGEIKNLTVENAKVAGYLNVGVVAGCPYTSKYTNITVKGHVEVNGYAYVGGVGGKNAYANWTDITVDADATSYVKAESENYRTYVGGVSGFNGEGGHTFKNITSNINVYGSTCDVGGLFGLAHGNNKFENCKSSGNVEITAAQDAGDDEMMGGIAGQWMNSADYPTVTFTNCEFTGTLKSNLGADLSDNTIYGMSYNATSQVGTLIIDGVARQHVYKNAVWVNANGEYEIDNVEGLKWFRDTVNAQLNDIFDGATVNLMNDIDLGGEEWIPVGDYRNSSGTQFGSATKPSKFNGNYHTIKNFKVTQKTAKGDSDKSSYGLFANVHADIENLTVQDAVVDLSNATKCGYVGALVGRLNGGSLTNCHVVNATVAASFWQAGALVGQMNSNGKISGCSVTTANIAAQSAVGSLVGIICNGGENVIENSEATNVNITMLDNSYGDNYKKMFGALVGALYNGARTTYLNNCEFANVTVKGQASNIAVGSYEEGDIVYIDGYQFITDGVMVADLGQGAYEISNVNGFKWFRDTVNSGANTFKGKTVKLMNDINLGGEEWTPIGVESYANNFVGTFDGNGKKVSNFKVTHVKTAGLFGTTTSAHIKNLTVSDAELNSNHYVGGILAWGESGATRIVIDNCHVKNVKLTSTPELVNSSYDNGDKVGGIAGFLHVGTISNCSVENVNIKAYRDMGGILGCSNKATVLTYNKVLSNVNIEVDNTQNYKDYKIQKDYNVGNHVGSYRNGAPVADATNTGSVNIEWNGIMKNGAGFSAEAGGTDFDW